MTVDHLYDATQAPDNRSARSTTLALANLRAASPAEVRAQRGAVRATLDAYGHVVACVVVEASALYPTHELPPGDWPQAPAGMTMDVAMARLFAASLPLGR